MRQLRFILTMLLAMVCGAQLMAQGVEVAEAFYIYRNDGMFHGFFYDEVKEMRYSKTDLNGEEHDDYVVQEVETTDSIYRIPLCAIDSVGFVQPKATYAQGVIFADEVGLLDYVERYIHYNNDDVVCDILFKPNTPEDILPGEGSKIVSYTQTYEGKPLVGKVTWWQDYSDGSRRIRLSKMQNLEDMFVRLIGVEQLVQDPVTRQVHRRISSPLRASGKGEATLLNLEGNLKKDFEEGRSKITLGVDYGFKLGMRVEYNLSWKTLFIKTEVSRQLSAQAGISGELTLAKYEPDPVDLFPAFKIKFPVECPLLEVSPLPKMFFKASGELAADIKLPKVEFSDKDTYVITDEGISYNYTCDTLGLKLDKESVLKAIASGSASITLKGSAHTGVLANIGIGTNSWFEDLVKLYIGIDVYMGPKIEGNISFDAAALYAGGEYYAVKDSKIAVHTFAIDAEAKGTMKYLWNDPEGSTFADKSWQFGTTEFYLLPNVSEFKGEFNRETGLTELTCKLDRDVLFPSTVGYYINGETYYFDRDYTLTCDFDCPRITVDLPTGKYDAYPVVKILGKEFKVYSERKDVIVPVKFEVLQTEFVVEPPKGDDDYFDLKIPYKNNVEERYNRFVTNPLPNNGPIISSCATWEEYKNPYLFDVDHDGNIVIRFKRNRTLNDWVYKLKIYNRDSYTEDSQTITVTLKKDPNIIKGLKIKEASRAGILNDLDCEFTNINVEYSDNGEVTITGDASGTKEETRQESFDSYEYKWEMLCIANKTWTVKAVFDFSDSQNYYLKSATMRSNYTMNMEFKSDNGSFYCPYLKDYARCTENYRKETCLEEFSLNPAEIRSSSEYLYATPTYASYQMRYTNETYFPYTPSSSDKEKGEVRYEEIVENKPGTTTHDVFLIGPTFEKP